MANDDDDQATRSTILAAEYTVSDFTQWQSVLAQAPPELRRLGARRLVVYRALDDGDRVFSTVGVRDVRRVQKLVASTLPLEWFDLAGVQDIPSLFVGARIERIDLVQSTEHQVGEVIVAGIVRLDDPRRWLAEVHEAADDLRDGGVLRVYTFQAFDDDREMLILQAIDTEKHARRWMTYHDNVAAWMARAGIGAYPPLFVGRLAIDMRMDD
jgi:hypothetical protein